jgi:uncharacterized phage protein gp47/JayE
MPNYIGNYGDIVTRGIKALTTQTNIRQVAAGSKARSVIEVHAQEMSNLATLQDTNIKKVFLPTTFGPSLQHFAATVGLSQYAPRNANALSDDRVFRFYVRGGGTFGSINNSTGFTIPAGVTLTSPSSIAYEATSLYGYQEEPDTVYDRSIHYITTEDSLAGSEDTELFVSAEALTPGSDGNLASAKMIKSHNFTGYDDYLGKSLIVENIKPVLNGVDEESPASLRYRVSKEITSAEKANLVAITNAAISVPGVADVVVLPHEDGVGRYNLYIKSISTIVSDKTVEDVQLAIDRVQAVGCIGYVRKPYEIGIELDTTISFKSDYEDEVKEEIRNGIELASMQYLNSMGLGQSLIIQEFVSELKQVDSRISAVGFNPVTMFDAVFAWFPAKLAEGGKRREKIISETLTVPPYARIMTEGSISDAVRIV